MKKLIVSFLCSLIFISISFGQGKNDPILLTVAGTSIPKSEFEKIYKKNNVKEAANDKRSVQDYLDLYINYKLKVKEAEDSKLDTSSSFKEELEGYRKQLAQPYLTDKVVTDNLIKEAYERYKKDVRASHILIKIAPEALPKDTLAAYNKIIRIRESILKGADFGTSAKENSEDPSAKENKGDLGYFTAMQMVYPFESAAFNAKLSEVTMPVRTRFGYHIIKVTDSRPAQGEIRVAHIMVKAGADISAEDSIKARTKIEEIYNKLKAGENFEELAKQHSDDVNSGRSGGALPWFGTGRMVPEFESAAFKLKSNDEFSAPVKSPYGWHIIKRLEKRDIPTYEAMLPDLKAKIAKDSRSEVSKKSLITRIKKEYKFKEFPKAKEEIANAVDSSFIKNQWSVDKVKALSKPVFRLGEKNYTQQDFAKFLANHQGAKANASAKGIVLSLYDQFVVESSIAYEEMQLPFKYPDFKALMQEYKDGILLFELTDKKVWSKAVKDSAGLAEFYEKNKKNYMWGDRLEASIYSCSDLKTANQVREMVVKGNIKNDSILNLVNKDSQLNLNIKEGKFSLGDNEIIDSIKWEKGMTGNITKKTGVHFVNVKQKLMPEPKTLDEAKGLVTADYQAYLEKDWIATLRKKYPVTVNSEVLSKIAQ